MNKKLKLITSIMTIFALSPTLALAQGGDDPIEGIDIIMKEDPSHIPIANFSLSEEEMKPQKRKMSFDARRAYLIKCILPRLGKINKKHNFKIKWKPILHKGFDCVWCEPKESHNTIVILTLSIPKDGNSSKVRCKLTNRKLKPDPKKPAPKKVKPSRKK